MTRESECGNKVRYQDRAAAKRAIRRLQGRDGRLRAYPCSWCPWFHIGHPDEGARMAARVRRSTPFPAS